MRKRTAGGKSTTRWRLSFWGFSIGFRIITVLFHKKQSVRMGCFFYKKRRLELPRALGKVPAEKRHAAYLIVPYRKLLHLIDFGKKTSAQ